MSTARSDGIHLQTISTTASAPNRLPVSRVSPSFNVLISEAVDWCVPDGGSIALRRRILARRP